MTASNSVSPATRIHPPTRYRRHRHGQFACNHEQSIVNGLSQTAPPPGRVGPGRAGSWRDDESSPRSCSRGSGKSRCHYDKSRRRTLLSISHVARVNQSRGASQFVRYRHDCLCVCLFRRGFDSIRFVLPAAAAATTSVTETTASQLLVHTHLHSKDGDNER